MQEMGKKNPAFQRSGHCIQLLSKNDGLMFTCLKLSYREPHCTLPNRIGGTVLHRTELHVALAYANEHNQPSSKKKKKVMSSLKKKVLIDVSVNSFILKGQVVSHLNYIRTGLMGLSSSASLHLFH
jgi:hypothetical protein